MTTIAFRLYLVLLLFAPLAFGCVEPWSAAILEIGCLAALFLWVAGRRGGDYYRVPGLLPFLLFLGLLFVQLVPLPALLVKLLSPAAYELYQGTIGLVEPVGWLPLSINPESTLPEFFRYTAYAAFYFLTVQLLADRDRLRSTVQVVVATAAGIAVQAILQHFLDNGRIYWLRDAPAGTNFVGPYVYKNHFAGYMEMVLPVAMFMFLCHAPRLRYGRNLREKIVLFFDHPHANRQLLFGLAALCMASSLLVSLSRGGIISAAAALAVVLLLLMFRLRTVGPGQLFLLLVVAVILAGSWFGWEPLMAYFAAMRDGEGGLTNGRFDYWQDSLPLARDFFSFGSGWDTFGNIFPTYRTVAGDAFISHAHNDYIETFVNGGLTGYLLIAAFWAAFCRAVLPAYQQRREQFNIYLYLGCCGGLLALLLHSITDFNFANNANGLYFFFLAGLAVAAAHTRMHQPHLSLMPTRRFGSLRWLCCFAAALAMSLTVAARHGSALAGALHRERVKALAWIDTAKAEENFAVASREMLTALRWDPLNSYYHFIVADLFAGQGKDYVGPAAAHYQAAIRLNPAQAAYLQGYGLFLDRTGGDPATVEGLLRAAIRCDRSRSSRYWTYGEWLLDGGRQADGLTAFREALALEPGETARCIDFLAARGIGGAQLEQTIPERVVACIVGGEYFARQGETERATVLYRRALAALQQETKKEAGYFFRISDFFAKNGRTEEALQVMAAAAAALPEDDTIRSRYAGLYAGLGIRYRAAEEYQKALSINPANQAARKGLEALGVE
ncbi:MAG: hypothetical protein A2521_01145 [Deltaproteobacteria bacterium RIFOXYD12_FULL_57_12]|nr:MAG: hypothetical protein A2521_01145 [Deltaproteobacteria bacterium RIFOXYD12_FULL_57_12]